MYKPMPIDTTEIRLGEELQACVEMLARNTHEVWAEERMRTGWVYGKERNDERKTHPGIVPYELLTEEEKEYDRHTTMQVIKTLIKTGYVIEKRND